MRWITLKATSPSGKTLFACRYCGHITPAPVKECPQVTTRPNGASFLPPSSPCHEIEKKEREELLHPILKNSLLPLSLLADRLKELYQKKATGQARELLTEQRDVIVQVAKGVVFRLLEEDRRLQWQVWEKLDALREELKRDGRT